jgi:hypothetical protein
MKTNILFWFVYFAQFFLEWEMLQTILQRKPKHTFYVQEPFSEDRAVVEPDGPHTTAWHMRIACWVPKNTDIHNAFPLQQWLEERASTLRYTYIVLFNLRRSRRDIDINVHRSSL